MQQAAQRLPELRRKRLIFDHRRLLILLSALLGLSIALAMAGQAQLPGPASLWTPLGCFLVSLGVALRFWACLYIGGRKNRVLVTEGPYALIRNPLYMGNLVTALGLTLLTLILPVVALVMLLLIIVWRLTIAGEEARLAELFGDAYSTYCRHVPRLIPAPALLRAFLDDPDPVNVSHVNMSRELARAALVLGLAWIIIFLRGTIGA